MKANWIKNEKFLQNWRSTSKILVAKILLSIQECILHSLFNKVWNGIHEPICFFNTFSSLNFISVLSLCEYVYQKKIRILEKASLKITFSRFCWLIFNHGLSGFGKKITIWYSSRHETYIWPPKHPANYKKKFQTKNNIQHKSFVLPELETRTKQIDSIKDSEGFMFEWMWNFSVPK